MKYILILCSVFIFASCGSTKTIKNNGEVEDIATAKLISNYYSNTFEFKTLAARMKVRYKDRKNSQSVTVSLRMDKGKTIWMSASILGISLAKVKVTPTSVSYYEKIGRTYFDGDFKFLSEYFGVNMDYEQLERLLIGETVYDLRKGEYAIDQVENQYQITPKKQLEILNLFFILDLHELSLSNKCNIVTRKTFRSASNTIPSPTSDGERKKPPSKDVRKGWYDNAFSMSLSIQRAKTPMPCTQV